MKLRLIPALTVVFSLAALLLACLALHRQPNEYPGFASPEELLRRTALDPKSRYGSAYDVALKRENLSEIRSTLELGRIFRHEPFALGLVRHRLTGKEVRYAVWMREYRGRWYRHSIAPEDRALFKNEMQAWEHEMGTTESKWKRQGELDI